MRYIHYTEEFKNKIAEDSKRDLIYSKIEDLKSIDRLEGLNSIDPYSKGILVLKFVKAYTCRIIMQPMTIDVDGSQVLVLFIRDFVGKKRFDYFWGGIIHPQLSNGDWLVKNPLSFEEIDSFKQHYIKTLATNHDSRPTLPDSLTRWINDFRIKLHFDVYEREEWVLYSNDISPNGLQEKYILFFKNTLKGILSQDPDNKIIVTEIDSNYKIYSAVYEPFNVGIIYCDFTDFDGTRIIVIYDGAHLREQEKRWAVAINKIKQKENVIQPSLLNISKDAFRAYPKWIVLNNDSDDWTSIQRYKGSYNLSLLPEQVSFLNNFKFPTYINGQAGSGKSTMLYYLFANVYFYKCMGEQIGGDIIFLTENDHLLEHTSQSIVGLLSNNPEFNIGFSIEERNNIRKHFCAFKNYLLEMLPEEEQSIYQIGKYLDFAKFKELFNAATSLSKKYSPEEIWFVISTYVYGYYEDRVIDTLEKYTAETGIPSKFRIVDNDHFKEIVTLYLNFYNKLIEEGWWDKITLVRAIRKFYPTSLPKQFAVVFCDEAQDFTRIELRLIIQSSLFTTYDLSEVDQVPIVFAGDALQTVSPTGFSDTRLHQMYYDAFNEANFKYDKTKSTYNPKFNYRSFQPIVRLANVVQNFRKETLREDIFIKQEAKRDGMAAPIPMLHIKSWLSQPENKEIFHTKFKYKSFIIPVDLNEEDNYIEGESLLDHTFTDIKSSIDAKGAEYSQVVVYGFGEYYMKEFGQLTWNDNDNNFKKRFFFNKLYVALTRAQNELIIIDSDDSVDGFWRPLLNIPADIHDRWEIYSGIEDILPINPQTGLSDVLESTPTDALLNATLDMQQGIRDKNIARLQVASNVFLLLGKLDDANNCLGHKEMIRERWLESGNFFLKANKIEDAANSFFQGKAWSQLKNIKSLSGNKQEARLLVLKLMTNEKWEKDELTQIYDQRNALSELMVNISWYQEYCLKLKNYASGIVNSEEKRELAYILESVVKDNDTSIWHLIGKLYYDTKKFSTAIEAWNKVLFVDKTPDYFPDYIKANIEKAIDEHNKLEEILWTGRLLKKEIVIGEKRTLSKKIFSFYSNKKNQLNESDLKDELNYHIFHAQIILGILENINGLAYKTEKAFQHLSLLSEIYAALIYDSANEGIAIFLKERWAKAKWNELIKANPSINPIDNINDFFSHQQFPFADSNSPWSEEEINQIPDIPSSISSTPDLQFKSITIKNFRRFRQIEISNIGQFNLVLGNNNSGKTTLLESLLFSPIPNVCLLNFLYARKQRTNSAEKDKNHNLLINLINRDASEKQIEYIIKDGRRFWSYILKAPTASELLELKSEGESADPRQYISITENSQNVLISSKIDILLFDLNDAATLKNIPFVPFGKGYSEKLASIYYSEIGSKRSVRDAFITQMKLFIPNVIDISVDPETDAIKIEEEGDSGDEFSSLHDYGEGANKLFRILVQLHAAKNGRLMIDEIDAGIHYSRFKEFWQIILTTAKEYNVQLFVTTHNDECINYFIEILNLESYTAYRELSRIITLEHHIHNKNIVPIVREYSNMKFTQDNNIEVRGRAI